MTTSFTPTIHPPGRWLAALAGSLVLWGFAYAQAPAPAGPLSWPAPGAGQLSYEVASHPPATRSRLGRLLLNDSDNAVALRQLAAGYADAILASAAEPAGPDRAPSLRMVAANTGPNTHLAEPK